MYRVDLLSDVILFKLYERHVSSDEELDLNLKEIAQLFDERVPLNLVRSSIDILRQGDYERNRLVKRKGDKLNYKYDISLAGIGRVQDELRRTSSPIAFYSADASRNLEAVAGVHSDFMDSADRTNAEAWTPLPIDRESSAFIEMQSSIGEAVEVIEADNGFAIY
jgi:hypothetical protein